MTLKPIVLIDGLNLCWRMHYAHFGLTTKKGDKSGVIYGALKAIIDLNRKLGSCDLIWCWEGGIGDGTHVRSWRKKISKDYKSNRTLSPDRESVMSQAEEVRKATTMLQYTQFYLPGLEADDLIGITSKVLSDQHDELRVYILTTDRDLFQCIDDRVTVLRPGGGRLTRHTARDVVREFGVTPEQWAGYKALVGDSTDNYKGAPGVGPKGAVKMIADGVDPSLRFWLTQPNVVRDTYPKLGALWEEVHKCFHLSYIPRSITFEHFDRGVRMELKKQLKELLTIRHRTMSQRQYNAALSYWTTFCARWELDSFLVNRRKFFSDCRVL